MSDPLEIEFTTLVRVRAEMTLKVVSGQRSTILDVARMAPALAREFVKEAITEHDSSPKWTAQFGVVEVATPKVLEVRGVWKSEAPE